MEDVILSRRERERYMRRDDMLRAAQAVFAEKGYAQATVDEIAHRAEYGKGTLYNYFPGGKEDILFAIFDELYDAICGSIDEAFSANSAAERPFRETFRDAMEAIFKFFLDRQELFLLLIKEAHRMLLNEDREKAAYFVRQRDRVVESFRAPVEKAIAAGELKPLPPIAIAHLVWGNVSGIQMHLCVECADGCPKQSLLETASDAADFLTTSLLDGLSRDGQAKSNSNHDVRA